MKNYLILMSFVLGIITLTFTKCTKSEENLCDATKQDQILRAFVISANIRYNEGKVYQGEFKFDIYKVYCNEKVSGHYWDRFDTNENGYWLSGMKYEYSFANSQDKVIIEFTIYNPGGTEYVEEEVYMYSDVKNNDHDIFFTCDIRLPWEAPYE
jgi:hypothetical protein